MWLHAMYVFIACFIGGALPGVVLYGPSLWRDWREERAFDVDAWMGAQRELSRARLSEYDSGMTFEQRWVELRRDLSA